MLKIARNQHPLFRLVELALQRPDLSTEFRAYLAGLQL